jgi:VWFA-related protein
MTRNLLAAVFCLTAFTIAAQELPRAGATIEVSIVNVDVIVTDREGNRVHGLTKDDFEILENGRPQPVTNFAEYAADGPDARVGVVGAQDEVQREKRTFLIFFEKMQLTGFGANDITAALKQTVAEMIRPGDRVSIVYWSRWDIEHLDVGDDPAKIADALDFLNKKSKTVHFDERLQFQEEQGARRTLREGMGGGGSGSGRTQPGLEMSEDGMGPILPMQLAYNEMTLRVAAINAAINSIAGIDGKKILLLAARRLGDVAGAEFIYHDGAQTIPGHLRSNYSTGRLLGSIVDNANAAGITIYPVYAPGLEGVGSGADLQTLMNERFSIDRIARETGGLSAAGPADVVKLLPRIATDASNYYSLAYRVGSDGTDRARTIAVKTRNPEYVVRTRTQFVEKSDDTRMRDRLKAALFRSHPESSIAISVEAGKAKRSRRTYTVPVQVKIPIRQLTLIQRDDVKKHTGRFSVYIGVATELNELSDVTQKTQPFEVTAAQLKKALASHFTYEMDVEVTGKSKYLAVGVFDEVGRTYGLQRIELEQKK